MKRPVNIKLILILIAAFALHLSAFSQNRLLAELPTGAGITKTYISKDMIRLNPQQVAGMTMRYGALFDEIEDIEVYDCDNSSVAGRAKELINKILGKYKKVDLMMTEDDEDCTSIFLLYNKNNDKDAIGYGVYTTEPYSISFVFIRGKIKSSANMTR